MLGIAGQVLGTVAQLIGQDSANKSNASIARRQENFQRDMSNTSHVREVADLKAAGLNPLLSANGGASTPSGSSATMQNVAAGLSSSATDAANLSLAQKRQGQEIKNLESQEKLANAQAVKTQMDTLVASKGIPQAELINKAYGIGKKLLDHVSTTAKDPRAFQIHPRYHSPQKPLQLKKD